MNIILKVLSIVCLVVAAGFLLVSCKNLVKPVDGPGMERDSADFANEPDSTKAQSQAKTASTQDGANAIYEPRIKDGAVYLDFNMKLCEQYAQEKLDAPCNILEDTYKVEGLEGRCVEVLKCIIGNGGKNFDGIGDPCLVMRTDKGRIFLLSIREAVEEGDVTCGEYMNLQDVNVKGLAILQDKETGEVAAAVLPNGSKRPVGLSTWWGYYVVDGSGFVIHLSRDWCLTLENREDTGGCHLTGWYGSKVSGHGQVLFYSNLELGIEADVDTETGDEPVIPFMTLDYDKGQLSLPVPSGKALKVERLYNNPWDWGYFQNKQ